MHLEIITPDKTIFDDEVESATFPGSKGSFQVLKNHAALISSLDKGKVTYRINNNEQEIVVNGGVVEVLNDNIILLAEEIIEE
ncbi:MAG: ATP synthase F1 subunit epsilon [Cyclobacteriaceae bacterium]|nr:ATP synthase F1 subunit epsilon [Cyclobacteriaceae bacterium]